jgi:hypothetical protein
VYHRSVSCLPLSYFRFVSVISLVITKDPVLAVDNAYSVIANRYGKSNRSGLMANGQNSERLVRWEAIRREQLSYAINLFLTLSVASLGFEATLILGAEFEHYAHCQQFGLLLSLALLAGAVLLGILAAVVRVCDFRLTADIVRTKENDAEDPELDRMRGMAHMAGGITWFCFWGLVSAYTVGTGMLALSVLARAASKLS